MQLSLFDEGPSPKTLAPGCLHLPGAALGKVPAIMSALADIIAQSPFRQMQTPGGHTMSVFMSNCGQVGWVSDRKGYRYQSLDPVSGQEWPPMPALLADMAQGAAEQAGFDHFRPDACLINRYQLGAKMGLHQDRDEVDFTQPIVSLSLGLSGQFQLGGTERQHPVQKVVLQHGDLLVFGGESRLRYHGILPLKQSLDPFPHPLLQGVRINLTFRRARP